NTRNRGTLISEPRLTRREAGDADVDRIAGLGGVGPSELVERSGLTNANGGCGIVDAVDAGVLGARRGKSEQGIHSLTERRQPRELAESARVEMLIADALEVVRRRRGEIRRAHVATDELRRGKVEQFVARDRAQRLSAHLVPARLLDAFLAGVDVRGGQPLRLVVRAQRRPAVIGSRFGDCVDDAALKIAVLGAGPQSGNVNGVDPVHAERQKVAAESRMVYRESVELIVV